VVLDSAPGQIARAAQRYVDVVPLNRPNESVFLPSFLSDLLDALKGAACTPGTDSIWIGHDVITGPIALDAARKTGGKAALIHHMSYADYEAYAESAPKAAEKVTKQRDLFSRADILLAVGPVLRDALLDLQDRPVEMLIPGLAEITPAQAPRTFTGFLGGRISDDTNRIKQAHLGVAGFAEAIRRANSNDIFPDVLRSGQNPTLKVYGLRAEGGTSKDSSEAEAELKEFSAQYAERVINLRALPFTTDRETLFDELRRSTLALMPSWHEGFGLVAWEAIAAGVPLILSQKSGVYRFLREWKTSLFLGSIASIDIRGANAEPFFLPKDLDDVASAVIAIAKNPQNARTKASQLREDLLSNGFTWETCARRLLSALGLVQNSVPSFPTAPVLIPIESPGDEEVAITDETDNGLELPKPKWVSGRGLSISQLLRAEEAIVPFDPQRVPFLDEQLAWAKSEEFPIAIRLLAGGGGAGKTRLALELCHRLREEEWRTGFLPDAKRDPASLKKLSETLRATERPTVIVIDYAETRVSDLIALVKPLLSLSATGVVRILLLARGGGEWWERLAGIDPACEAIFAGRATSGPFEIPLLYDTLRARQTAFQSALDLFASKLALPVPHRLPDLAADYYSQPLLVQIAAMMTLHGEHAQSSEGLIRSLVNHERRYWGNLLGQSSTSSDQASQLMCLSTLFNGIQIPRLIEPIWEHARCGTKRELKDLFTQLAQLYPSKSGLEGLRPDLIGEALATQVLLSPVGSAMLNGILGKVNNRMRHQAWTVFARIVRYRADFMPLLQAATVANYSRNVMDAMDVCCQTAGPLSEVLEGAFDELSMNQKRQIAGLISPRFGEDVIPLNGLAKRVSEVILLQTRKRVAVAGERAPLDDRASLGRALSNFSVDLNRLGEAAAALEASEEAIKVWQRLAKSNPERFEPSWATSLSNYASYLTENGRAEQALPFAKEALDIRVRLAKKDPERFEPDWATSLGNYANNLGDDGHIEEALPFAKEALDVRARLAKKDPERFEPTWATSLSNYASHLSGNGRAEEALPFAKEALDIRARLAKSKPERFEPDWTTSLGNYASHLSENGRTGEALPFAKEAVDIRARLAKSKPERFEPDWTTSLGNYAIHLSENGRAEEALVFAKEALDIQARLAKTKPERFEPDWAHSLGNYANRLSENGRTEEALVFAKEALDIRARLAKTNPERFEPDWAHSLGNYANRLSDDGNYEMALHVAEQALEVYRQWANRIPMVYQVARERTQVFIAFAKWLKKLPSNGLGVDSQRTDLAIVEKPEWKGLLFFTHSVRSIIANDKVTRLSAANEALAQWLSLPVTEKKTWEDFYFVTAAMAESYAGVSDDQATPPVWRIRYDQALARRRAKVPHWFRDTADRLGLKF
jgi:glycosyltransferase involved in cell wall biosynthesis